MIDADTERLVEIRAGGMAEWVPGIRQRRRRKIKHDHCPMCELEDEAEDLRVQAALARSDAEAKGREASAAGVARAQALRDANNPPQF